MLLNVETVAGHAGMTEPVLEIIDRWPSMDYTYFKVAASDQATYILRHDAGLDIWELTLYNSPGR
jgi:hypothetical protein